MKIFTGRIRAVIRDATMQSYEKFLGANPDMLVKHQAMVDVTVQKMIDAGVSDPSNSCTRIDWDDTEMTALESVRRSQMITVSAGYRHMETEAYEAEFGKFEENQMASKGHKPWVYEGREGYYVPDRKQTQFKHQTMDEMVARTHISSTKDGLTKDDMVSMMKAFMSAQKARSLGHDGTAAAAGALLGEPAVEDVSNLATSPPSVKQPAAGQQGPGSPLDAPSSSGRGGASGTETPNVAKSKAKPRAQPKAQAAPKAQAESTEAKADTKAAAAAAKKRGRPTKDWEPVVAKMVETFQTSHASDPCHWGAEAKTQLKIIADSVKEINTRIQKATEQSELLTYTKLKKTLGVMSAIVKVVKDHGLDSEEFRKEYDLQDSGSPAFSQ